MLWWMLPPIFYGYTREKTGLGIPFGYYKAFKCSYGKFNSSKESFMGNEKILNSH